MSFTYSPSPLATLTGEVDALNFAKANASVTLSQAPFVAGASVDAAFGKQGLDSKSFGLGVGYSIPKLLFAGARATNSLSDFSGIFSYVLNKDVSLVGKVTHATAGKAAGTSSILAAVYQYDPSTVIKVKASSTGIINASVKKSFEKKFSVVGSVEIPQGFSSGYKFGLNAVLG